ncbi:hypothetical protein AB0J84_12630 [Micromonospora arborensis]|uniref:hypothetical protein n=1 Tax=Micromonospora arborensis TaxID=2116518 RepID=UPI003431CD88
MTRVDSRSAPPLEISPETWRLAWVVAFGAFAGGLDTSLINIALNTILQPLDSLRAAAPGGFDHAHLLDPPGVHVPRDLRFVAHAEVSFRAGNGIGVHLPPAIDGNTVIYVGNRLCPAVAGIHDVVALSTQRNEVLRPVGSTKGQVLQMRSIKPTTGRVPDLGKRRLSVVHRSQPTAPEAERLTPAEIGRFQVREDLFVPASPVLHNAVERWHVATATAHQLRPLSFARH